MYYLVVSFNLLKSQQIRITFILQEEKQLLREEKLPNLAQPVDCSYHLKKVLFYSRAHGVSVTML